MKKMFTLIILVATLLFPIFVLGQGSTTSSLSGKISDKENVNLAGAVVEATHVPSGTYYATAATTNGSFAIQNMRVGGPYTLRFTYLGCQTQVVTDVVLKLGEVTSIDVVLEPENMQVDEIVVTASKMFGMKATSKSGVGLLLGNAALTSMPTVSRSISDFTRMLPQAGSQGMMGKGAKSNNLTVDGASFNNYFGLGGEATGAMPGMNAGAQPISLDALDQISIEASPYDVKIGGFTGAGINVITKSGDNTFRASVYDYFRNQSFMGRKIKDSKLTISDFSENTVGVRVGGPIVKNKLFFFVNVESVSKVYPVSNIIAGRDDLSGANISNIKASTLDELSGFLQNAYQYNPGSYEDVSGKQKSLKFLVKLDWNINKSNKLSVRYNQLTAKSVNGNLGTVSGLKYSSMLYDRNNEIYSITGELNSKITDRLSNRFFTAYTSSPDYRNPYRQPVFPTVTIAEANTISFGTDAAANNNRMDQKVFQLQDEITYLLNSNKFTAGFNWQYMDVANNFTLNNQGAYTFATLNDFYNASAAGTVIPGGGTSTGLGRPSKYSLNYTVQPGRDVTISNPKVSQLGFYLQDEITFSPKFTLSGGIRFDIVSFLNSPGENPEVKDMTFQNAQGEPAKYNTSDTPGSKLLVSPRVGFNWTVDDAKNLTIKGGIGMFTGLVPFVFIEKQYAINGMNEGQINASSPNDAAKYPFNPNPASYRPDISTASKLPSYEVDLVSPGFRMPQTLRTSLGGTYRLPADWRIGVEAVYSTDYNNPYYINANLDQKTATTAADGRVKYTNNKLNGPTITRAYVLDNTNQGDQFFVTASLRKSFSSGMSISVAYTYGKSKSPFEFSSTSPGGSFNGIAVVGNPNIPIMSYGMFDLRHRIVADFSHRFVYAKGRLATTVGLFFQASQQGRVSYTYGGTGDVNNDGVNTNDLIFIPATKDQIKLVANKDISIDDQWNALDKFISDSPYLSSRRGKFAERNGAITPWSVQADLHVAQEVALAKKRNHKIEITFDILNLTNMLNKNWGYTQVAANASPITALSGGTFNVTPTNLKRGEFIPFADQSSAWSMQIGLRFTFN